MKVEVPYRELSVSEIAAIAVNCKLTVDFVRQFFVIPNPELEYEDDSTLALQAWTEDMGIPMEDVEETLLIMDETEPEPELEAEEDMRRKREIEARSGFAVQFFYSFCILAHLPEWPEWKPNRNSGGFKDLSFGVGRIPDNLWFDFRGKPFINFDKLLSNDTDSDAPDDNDIGF